MDPSSCANTFITRVPWLRLFWDKQALVMHARNCSSSSSVLCSFAVSQVIPYGSQPVSQFLLFLWFLGGVLWPHGWIFHSVICFHCINHFCCFGNDFRLLFICLFGQYSKNKRYFVTCAVQSPSQWRKTYFFCSACNSIHLFACQFSTGKLVC